MLISEIIVGSSSPLAERKKDLFTEHQNRSILAILPYRTNSIMDLSICRFFIKSKFTLSLTNTFFSCTVKFLRFLFKDVLMNSRDFVDI